MCFDKKCLKMIIDYDPARTLLGRRGPLDVAMVCQEVQIY